MPLLPPHLLMGAHDDNSLFLTNPVFFTLGFGRNLRSVSFKSMWKIGITIESDTADGYHYYLHRIESSAAHLVTSPKGNGRHRQELGNPIFAAWLSHSGYEKCATSRWRNGVRRGREVRTGGGRVARPTIFPWQHYAVYDRRAPRDARPAQEGHDPRYDLVKKPFNVSTSQRLRYDSTQETPRGDAKTFIIIAPPIRSSASRLLPGASDNSSTEHSSNRDTTAAHNSFS